MKFVGLLVSCGMCVIATDLKNSVFFQKRKTFNIVRSTWFVSIILDLKPYVGFLNEVGNNCAYTQRLIASTQMKLSNTVQNSSFIKQFEFLGKEVRELEWGQENLNILLGEYQILMTLSKRSILPFVGKLSTFLFGTVNEDQLRGLKAAINQLGRQQSNLVHIVQEQITVMNRSRELISENRLAINQINLKLRDLDMKMDNITQYLIHQIFDLNDFLECYTQLLHTVSVLRQMIQNAYVFNDHLKSELNVLGTGKISPEIISPKQLRSLLLIIKSEIPRLAKLPFNPERRLWQYYEILEASTFMDTDQIVIVLKIPLRDSRFQFELYKVLNLEMALNYTPRDMTAYIALQSQYLAINLERTKYMLLEEENERQCSRPLLKFCEVSNPIYNVVSRQQYLVALFFNQTENIEKLCVKMINVNARLPLITEINPHLWAVTTKSPLRFSVVCYDKKAVTKEIIINPPLGVLYLNSSCNANNDFVSLIAGSDTSITFKIDDPFIRLLRKINFTGISLYREVNQELPKFMISSLSLPPILDSMDTIPMNKLLTELRKVQSPQLTFLEQYGFWGLPGLILIVLVIIIIVVWVKNHKKIKGYLVGRMQGSGRKNITESWEIHVMKGERNSSPGISGNQSTSNQQHRGEETQVVHLYPQIDLSSEGDGEK